MAIELKKEDGWERAGICGVDSGQILFVDPCYVEEGLNYDSACSVTLDKSYGAACQGVVMSSGYGDGGYAGYVRHTETDGGKRVTAGIIDFCEEVEWDGEEKEEDGDE